MWIDSRSFGFSQLLPTAAWGWGKLELRPRAARAQSLPMSLQSRAVPLAETPWGWRQGDAPHSNREEWGMGPLLG